MLLTTPGLYCKYLRCILQEVKDLCDKAKEILTTEANIKQVRDSFIGAMYFFFRTEKIGENVCLRTLKTVTISVQVVTPVTVVGDVHGQV